MNPTAQLSKRELEVAEVLAFTKSKTDAADKLCISEGTLAAHSYRIYGKLEINTKAELVIWWFIKKYKIAINELPVFTLALIMSLGVMTVEHKRPSRRTRQRETITLNTTI